MKKIIPVFLALFLCASLTACNSHGQVENSKTMEESFLTDSNSGTSSASGDSIVLENLTGGIYTTYDRTKYDNVIAPKCYYAEFMKINDEALLELFSSAPQYSEEMGAYITDTEMGANTPNALLRRDGSVDMYFMLYSTPEGNDYDTAVGENHAQYSTTKEFDFMTRDNLTADLSKKLEKIFITPLDINIYAIDGEEYLKEIENFKHQQRPQTASSEKEWSKACDYYYIKGCQTVDKIPIFEGMYGDVEKGTLVEGCAIKAVYTKNGLEYLRVDSPWQIMDEFLIDDEFITLKGAEEIIVAYNENLLTSRKCTLEDVRLVYIPIVKPDGTILTPVWEFYDYMGVQYPVYRVNAYTGEMLK